MSMLRDLHRSDAIGDVVHIHSARTADDVIFAERLRKIDEAHEGFDLQLHISGERGRIAPAELDALCPDWRERQAYVSGPGAMLDAMCEHWEREGDPQLLHMERFQPIIGGDARRGRGRHDPLPEERRRGRVRRRHCRSSSPARRPAPRFPSAAGWASATPASGGSARARSATCAPARSTAARVR